MSLLGAAGAALRGVRIGGRGSLMMRFGVVGAVWGLFMAAGPFTAAADPQSCLGSFGYTGAKVSCVIPPGVSAVHVVAVGGQGGTVPSADAMGSGGGLGAIVKSNLAVTPGEILDVYVGGNGGSLATAVNAGGFNGGGAGGEDGDFNQEIVAFTSGSGGGGASDVRPQNGSLDQRLIVAGGGGGYGGGVNYHNYAAGGAGGDAGQPGGTAVGFGASTCSDVCDGEGGGPGIQSDGGAGGYGCPRLTETNSAPDGLSGALGAGGAGSNPALINSGAGGGGGGGGGWYGGGGGGARGCELGGGGGGGSSFPAAAVVGFDPTGTPQVTFSAAVPTVVAPPSIVGTAVVGQTLFLQRGAWSHSPTGYQESWLRCNVTGAECQPISAQPGLSYPLTPADVNSTIRVQEVTSNAFGSGVAATSAATAPVVSSPTSGATAPVSAPTSGTTPPITPARVAVRAFALVGTSRSAIAGPVAVFAELGVRGAPARDYSATINVGRSLDQSRHGGGRYVGRISGQRLPRVRAGRSLHALGDRHRGCGRFGCEHQPGERVRSVGLSEGVGREGQ